MTRTPTTKTITVPGNLRTACEQFNRGEFWECHESLEEIWQEEQGEVRDLYKGLIQVAAAFVHLSRGNYRGADRLLTTGVGYLEPYRAGGAMGFDVDGICAVAERAHARLRADGPEGTAVHPELTPVYAVDESKLAAEARRWSAWGFDRDGRALPMEILALD
jgi:hypothetical protein